MPKKENNEMAGGKVSKSDSSRSRGRRLAQRARSFKEDLLERFTQMRSPSSARSSSPSKSSPRTASKSDTLSHPADSSRRNEKDVHQLQRDVQFALRYFHDVVDKDTLEMLPGSATIVLENVLAIHTLLKNCLASEQSSLLLSTTNQVYQSLANLIRWADNVLLYGNHNHNKENVAEVVKDVREAIKTLIELADDKLQSKESRAVANNVAQHNGICTLKPNENSSPKRTSLPDIPLTPREREILELQTTTAMDDSAIQLTSTPSSLDTLFFNNGDLNDSASSGEVPPPKPPLPHHWGSAWRCPSAGNMADVIPPLPPKRKTVHAHSESLGSSFQSMGSWNGNTSPHQYHQHFRHHGNSLTALLGTDYVSGSHDANGHDLSRTSSSEWGSEFGSTPNSVSPMNASANSLDSVLDRSADELLTTTATAATTVESRTHFSSSSMTSSTVTAAEELHRLHVKLQKFSVHQELSSSLVTESMAISSSASSSQTTTWSVFGQQATSSTVESSSCRCASTASSSDIPLLPPPPAIPPKKRNLQRTPSQYDNLPELVVMDSSEEEHGGNSPLMHRRTTTEVRTSASAYCVFEKSESSRSDNGRPPPLPPKKKHIMAYMQMFGNYSEPNKNEFFRHSLHTYNLLQAQWQQQQHQSEMSFTNLRYLEMVNTHLRSNSDDADSSGYGSGNFRFSREEDTILSPPALPPKRNRGSVVSNRSRPSTSPTNPSPPMVDLNEKSASVPETGSKDLEAARVVAQPSSQKSSIEKKSDPEEAEENALDNLDVDNTLVHKKSGEEGPDIRGGSVDALIVRATKVSKNERSLSNKSPDFMYQEAFLTTYRTFISPLELIKKLLYRYNKFSIMTDVTRQRAARNAFALLVRVVDDLCVNDIEEIVLSTLMEFVFQLLCNGDLILARALRKKILEKCEAKKRVGNPAVVLLSSFSVTTRQSILLDFKSEQLAEQMTLLDADLFQKIEIPEVLIWAREQSEELSPNLTTFTEHFNKMSYWARSRILEQDDAKDREKYVVKFIKIMKHLRKLNNFNSYLAILSALDSAPIRRLEWQRHITEGLKEYCELIDSSSSFRAYRQALADTEPPCIPYIGLILQDLTFVHIGNSDSLGDSNVVNFSKRWQQFNILDNMRRFKKCNYHFKRHEKIISFFNNFDDYLCEEAMWQISESIKPRGGKKKTDHL